tara:strand:+ start:37 stop:399 length:363 start_codon:yes stop_codon:yes gene_type:complete
VFDIKNSWGAGSYFYSDFCGAFMDILTIQENIHTTSILFKSLSNQKRLLIMCALYDGEKSVGELEEYVKLSQSALSQHLARLRRDGIVKTRRQAQTIYYSIKDPSVRSVMNFLHELYCDK